MLDLSILNELTLQKKLQNCMLNYVFWTKNNNTTTTKQNSKHKNPCQNREPLAPQSGVLPLGHQVN